MTLVLSPPEWKAKEKYYIIKFAWDPTSKFDLLGDTVLDTEVIKNGSPILDTPSCKSIIQTIISSIVTQGTRWFAKPLQELSIRNRLKHQYNFDISGSLPDPPFQFNWIPTEIIVSSSQFILVWAISEYKEIKTQIPLSFLDDDEGLEEIDVTKDLTININDSETFTLKESQERVVHRERVKAARVRAAIAKYKSEVLIEQYRELYGDLSDSEEEDSDGESNGEESNCEESNGEDEDEGK